jgi:hypothetical protein
MITRDHARSATAELASGGRMASRWAISLKAVSLPVQTMTASPTRLNSSPKKTLLRRQLRFPRKIIRRLLDGQRLSRERGLAHVQVLDVQQASVRWHKVPSIEPDDVPRDQFCNRELLFSAIPENGSSRRHLLPDLLHRMSSLELHEEVQQYAEQDHRDDDQPADRVTQHERDGAGHEKDDDEGIGKEAKKTG